MFHLNTAKVVITDNYFVELAGLKERKNVTCIQIWHANGALKKFGWEDKAAQKEARAIKKDFKKCTDVFQKCSSDRMKWQQFSKGRFY